MPPGSLVHDPGAPMPVLQVIAFGPDGVVEELLERPEQVESIVGRHAVTWLNVDGLGDADTIARIGRIFGLHPLAMEDILDTTQRPKAEPYESQLFLVLRMPSLTDHLHMEQLSLFVGPGFVVTFQETSGDCFDELRDRIRRGRGRVRRHGPAYLAYALVDAVIDGYFPILERYGELLEALEDECIERPRSALVNPIHHVRRDILAIRRAVWPTRDMLAALAHDQATLDAETRLYIRDAHDHAVRIMDLLENFRDITSSLMEMYLASVSNRMNEIMKVLTIISTIFIPLGFISGLYGMNFSTSSPWNMPELDWRFGYLFALGIMAATASGLLLFFRRRGWIGSRSDDEAELPTLENPAPRGER